MYACLSNLINARGSFSHESFQPGMSVSESVVVGMSVN